MDRFRASTSKTPWSRWRRPKTRRIRLVANRAHGRGAHIEEMIRVGGTVGDTEPELRPFFDQGNSNLSRRVAEQVERHQHAACPATDDNHVGTRIGIGVFSFRHARSPPLSLREFGHWPISLDGVG